ncbi:dihydroorotase family protein [Candidatus Bathyarchaeota archaeon]|nr:dihydroorotase family protein [Candidatus Bathyarchaeota archaeon]
MTVDTVLYNSKIYFRGNLVNAGIAINDGKIVKIAKETNLPQASNKINLKGNITIPGLIDPHVHLRDQELSYKEEFYTGTAAAAAGGVTTVLDMPNNKPVTLDSFSLRKRMNLAKKRIITNVAFFSAFPKKIEEITEVVNTGAIGFKIYLSKGIGGLNINDDQALTVAFKEVAEKDVPVAVHAEDHKIIKEARKEMENAGRCDVEDYLKVHSSKAELQSINRVIPIVIKTGVHVHFCHVSSAMGLNSIIQAKKGGLPITCEVTPHNLLLSFKHYINSGNLSLTDPPLRKHKDVSTLWNGLKQGFINIIASDHAPHSLEEKNLSSVWEAKPGVPGLETTLSLLLNKVNENKLSISELVRITAEEPSRIFKLKKRGFIEERNWADLVVVDLKQKYKFDSSAFYSKAKYSPFDQMNGKGKPVKTFVNGKLVMDESKIILNSHYGKII